MYNKVIMGGNLTRDIELRYSNAGMAIAKTAIATSRKFTSNGEKKEEVMFIDITFFGRSAEVANQYLRKGSKVLIEGRLQFDQWVDQNGGKRSKHSVAVESMQMLDTKAKSTGQQQAQQQQGGQQPHYQPQQQYQQPQGQQHPQYPASHQQQNGVPVETEEIPAEHPNQAEIPF